MAQESINPIQILAVAKYFKDDSQVVKDAREQVQAGDYKLADRLILDLKGVLKVSVDGLTTPTPKLSGLKVLANFRRVLKDEGMSHQKISALIDKVIALSIENTADLPAEEVADLEESVKAAQVRVAKKLDKVPRKGNVAFKGIVEGTAKSDTFSRTTVQ